MQKRDKTGKFLKKKVSKKAIKKPVKKVAKMVKKPVKVQAQKAFKKIADISLYDLHDMITAEVAFQLRDW